MQLRHNNDEVWIVLTNHVPAVAVIHGELALSSKIRRKGYVDVSMTYIIDIIIDIELI